MKKRLIEFLTYLEIGQTKFEEMVGLSRGFVNKLGGNITIKSLSKIEKVYPQLNTGWLLTGEGSMIKTGDISYSGNSNNSGIIGTGNSNIVNNVNAYGYEKIIRPDGTITLELGKPGSKGVIGVAEIIGEYNALQEKVKLLENMCAAKDETIHAQKMTIEVLMSKLNA